MARAIQSGSIPLAAAAAGSSDSDLAPRKETQLPTMGEDEVNVKVSGGKRKKPTPSGTASAMTPRRAAAAVGKELKAHLLRRNQGDDGDTEGEAVEGEGEGERVVKSRRLMSPAEALLDSAQAVVPAPELHQRTGSVGAGRRSTTFTLRPPRDVDGGRERSASPEKGRYTAARRHRTSQSPGMAFSSAIVTTAATGMDTTIEEESGGDSTETSGARGNTTSMSALHGESSYEVMEREVQLARGRTNGRPTTSSFARPLAIAEEPDHHHRPPSFFPIPAQQAQGKRRTTRNIDNAPYRPLGGSLLLSTAGGGGGGGGAESTATDSADEDGGGIGLAAHLPERSTRGKRPEHGEGYLGTGMAFTPGGGGGGAGGKRKKDSGRAEESVGHAESVNEEKAVDLKAKRAGPRFNTPARRKSVSVSLSPANAEPSRQRDVVKQRYRDALGVSPPSLFSSTSSSPPLTLLAVPHTTRSQTVGGTAQMARHTRRTRGRTLVARESRADRCFRSTRTEWCPYGVPPASKGTEGRSVRVQRGDAGSLATSE